MPSRAARVALLLAVLALTALPGEGRLPACAAEVGVGPATAAELGWRAP